MGRSQQRKGRGGEIELARILQAAGYPVRPGQAVSFGAVPDLVGLPGVHVECKRNERLNLENAMDQSIKDAERFNDGIPCVFHRKNRRPWLVTMMLDDWLDMYGMKGGDNNDDSDGKSADGAAALPDQGND